MKIPTGDHKFFQQMAMVDHMLGNQMHYVAVTLLAPYTVSNEAASRSRRNLSATDSQTMILIVPASSSSVTNMVPRAVLGRWRTVTKRSCEPVGHREAGAIP